MARLRFQPYVTADGKFRGYGAVFGNVDSHGDVISKGAFTRTLEVWRDRGRWPHMRLMHGSAGNPFSFDDLPIGRWLDMREDATGLYVEGELLALDTDQGKRILSLMRGGAIDGMSIGFRTIRARNGSGRIKRYLDEVALTELSIVDDPSNSLARVQPISEVDTAFENLRDALGQISGKAASADPLDKIARILRSQ